MRRPVDAAAQPHTRADALVVPPHCCYSVTGALPGGVCELESLMAASGCDVVFDLMSCMHA